MSPEKNREMMTTLNTKGDWRGVCKECGLTLTGTPEAFRQHAESEHGA